METNFYTRFKQILTGNPLLTILITGLILRLLAAWFSKGFGMFDDHFLVIEPAQNWADGGDDWFKEGKPSGHSIFYPGIHYLFFLLTDALNFTDPQGKMFFVRLLHAVYSLLTVWLGYRIAENLAGQKAAILAGWLLAVLWFFPFMSVRNLIEMVAVPPVMMAFFLITLKPGTSRDQWLFPVFAGIFMGLAFAFRFQVLFLTGGIGLFLLITRQWKPFYYYFAGSVTGLFLFQGITDWIAWGYPLASFFDYIQYNMARSTAYITSPWYTYLLLIAGIFIPPSSFLFLWGLLKTWKKYLILFLPVLVFLVFHSIFPNKQERFILPSIPILVILGSIGWISLSEQLLYPVKKQWWIRGLIGWFLLINTILLSVMTFSYSKKARVEAMSVIGEQPDSRGVLMVDLKNSIPRPPEFYLGKAIPLYRISSESDSLEVISQQREHQKTVNYVIFPGDDEIDRRITYTSRHLGKTLIPFSEIQPGLLDRILTTLNPRHNRNQSAHIYRVENY